MQLDELFNDRSLKQKAKTELLSKSLLEKKLSIENLIEFAEKAKDVEKATCIEALEYATKQNPGIAIETCIKFVSDALTEKAPRVKMESAKVIGNIAHMFPTKLNKAIGNLLINSEDSGTVVRWAAAYALGEILKLKTKHNKDLLPTIEAICDRERDNAIKKKYQDAIKKIKRVAS